MFNAFESVFEIDIKRKLTKTEKDFKTESLNEICHVQVNNGFFLTES